MSDLMKAVIEATWPEGSAWTPAPGGDLDNMQEGSAQNWEVIRDWLEKLASVRDPAFTTFLIDLENEFGIAPNSSLTEAQRREALAPLVFERNSNGSVDTLQAALDSAGFDVTVYENDPAFDPAIFLNQIFQMVAGGGNAYAGHIDAQAGRSGGELLVNGDIYSFERLYTSGAGTAMAYAGAGFSAGEYQDLMREKIEYPIPTDPTTWPFVFFVGGALLQPAIDVFGYDGIGFDLDVSAQDTTPRGVAISSDGLHLYMAGDINDKIYAYTLGTAYDLSTAVYDGIGFDLDVSAQDTVLYGLAISSDGLHLYMGGSANNKVYAYTFGTAYDLSTAVYDGIGFDLSVSGQDTAPRGLTISSDGLHLYVSGATNDKVYAYTLGTAYDLSTAVYDGIGFDLDVSAQDTVPYGLAISSDGSHIYIVGSVNDKVYSYTFGTAYDLSTVTYDGSGFDLDVSAQDSQPFGVTISSDGLRLYVSGATNDKVYAYTSFTQAPIYELGQVPAVREQEFKRLILKIKPAHSWAALLLEYT